MSFFDSILWGFAPTYGAFTPTYYCELRTPKTNNEAQRLYNHCRTIAWYMDALPFVSQTLGFRVGIDPIISLIPVLGDSIGFMLSLYPIYLAQLFGAPNFFLCLMLLNIIIDLFIGFVPVIGDFLDVIFKA